MTEGTFDEFAGGLRARKHAKAWHAFLALPFAQYVIAATDAATTIVMMVIFVGANFHDAAIRWFHSDWSIYAHFQAQPLRYLILSGALIAVSAAAFQFAP